MIYLNIYFSAIEERKITNVQTRLIPGAWDE